MWISSFSSGYFYTGDEVGLAVAVHHYTINILCSVPPLFQQSYCFTNNTLCLITDNGQSSRVQKS